MICCRKGRLKFWRWPIEMATVIVTRPKPAVAKTTAVYREAGFKVFESPCFDIQTNQSVKPEWLTVEAEMWVVLSVHALHHALKIVPELKPGANTRVIAVGPAVAKAWQQHFNQDIEYHPSQNSEGVVEMLKKYQPKSIKILTTGDGRKVIKSHCMSHQVSYTQINTYQRIPLPVDIEALTALYKDKSAQPVVLTATSAGILEQFLSGLDDKLLATVKVSPLVVGAQRIADFATESGFSEVLVADSPGDQAMCEKVRELV